MDMKYVVYVFLDHRNRPYYVGKTNNMTRRRKEHLECIRTGDPLPKYNMARKLIRQGHKLKMRAIAKARSEAHAYAIESFFIKKFRKEGKVLFNLTSGGKKGKAIKINTVKKKKGKRRGAYAQRKPRKKGVRRT